MFEKDLIMNTGTRAATTALLGNELIAVISDARWLLLAIMICVLADFRYGWGESNKRFIEARKNGDKIRMAEYRWRTSRALRRTINKFLDYIMWVSIGMFAGMAILEPIGVDHILGGVAATAVAIICEAKSFCGHFFYLRGVKIQQKTITGFIRAFVVALLKKKDADVGEAVEESLNNINKK